MKALVVGANGLIGAGLVRDLLGRGVEVRGLVRETSDLDALADLDLDLRRGEGGAAIEEAARGCDLLFHAAMPFTYDRRRDAELDASLDGTEHALRAARAACVGRVVVTSSSVVFGYSLSAEARDESRGLADAAGENAYVRAKRRQHETVLRLGEELGLEVVLVCPTVTVGPHASTLGPSNGLIVAYLADPWRMTFPGGCNVVSSADVAAGHWLAARRGEPGGQYILGSENLEWRELHAVVADLAGVEPPQMMSSHGLAYLAATYEEVRAGIGGRPPLGTREQAAMAGRYYWYRHAAAERLGYRPRPARDALAEAISWLAASRHVSREVRTRLRLHDDVYAARYPLATTRRTAGGGA